MQEVEMTISRSFNVISVETDILGEEPRFFCGPFSENIYLFRQTSSDKKKYFFFNFFSLTFCHFYPFLSPKKLSQITFYSGLHSYLYKYQN